MASDTRKRLLVGCTGSVAALKIPQLTSNLLEKYNDHLDITVVPTSHATHFFNLTELDPRVEIFTDSDEWSQWRQRGDPVLHIELAKRCDALLLAPLDANSLAKVAGGLCDNLLTCIVRAWRPAKPLLFCPAMNTYMLQHPVTNVHLSTLRSWGYIEIPAICKKLVCGDEGPGAMAEVGTIVDAVSKTLFFS